MRSWRGVRSLRPDGTEEETDGAGNAELARELTPRAALLKMRTFVPRYLKHLDGARGLRQRLIQCTDWAEFDDIINVIASGEQA